MCFLISAQITNGKCGLVLVLHAKTGSRGGFLNLSVIDILDLIIFGMGGYPVHCRMISTIPGVYLLDANSNPHQVVTNKNVPKHCHMSSRGQYCPS